MRAVELANGSVRTVAGTGEKAHGGRYSLGKPTETPLRIVGRLVEMRGRRATAHGEVRLPDGTVAAEAQVLLAEMPASMLAGVDIEALGWQVADD